MATLEDLKSTPAPTRRQKKIIVVDGEDSCEDEQSSEDPVVGCPSHHEDLSFAKAAAASVSIPDDIVCEIIKHCHGPGWSYGRKAKLCLVSKADWLAPARKNLYSDIHLDYRHEVERLQCSFRLLPQNAVLVSSMFINGDAAHVAALATLLRGMERLRTCTFFDFELHSDQQQAELCDAVKSSSLETLSFQVLPSPFVLDVLHKCENTLKKLHIYRVDLERDQGWSGDPQSVSPTLAIQLTALEHIELHYAGGVSPKIFKTLVQDRAHALRILKLSFERSYPITTSAEWWQACEFAQLRHLELKHFHLSVVKAILESVRSSSPLGRTSALEHLSLTNVRNPAATLLQPEQLILGVNIVIEPDLTLELNSSRLAKGDDSELEELLEYIPPSLTHFELLEIRSEELCVLLPDFVATRLPRLVAFPQVTVLASAVSADCASETKKGLLEVARTRGFPPRTKEDEDNCCVRIKTWSAPSYF